LGTNKNTALDGPVCLCKLFTNLNLPSVADGVPKLYLGRVQVHK